MNTFNSKSKIPVKSLKDMEEDDRNFLEMFNCFGDPLSSGDQEENISSSSLIVQKEKKIKKRKILKSNSHFQKNHNQKKQIFKIDKIEKNETPQLVINISDANFILAFLKFREEVKGIIEYNQKTFSNILLNLGTVEENTKGLYKWINENPKFKEHELNVNVGYKVFIRNMEKLLKKWDSVVPCD